MQYHESLWNSNASTVSSPILSKKQQNLYYYYQEKSPSTYFRIHNPHCGVPFPFIWPFPKFLYLDTFWWGFHRKKLDIENIFFSRIRLYEIMIFPDFWVRIWAFNSLHQDFFLWTWPYYQRYLIYGNLPYYH